MDRKLSPEPVADRDAGRAARVESPAGRDSGSPSLVTALAFLQRAAGNTAVTGWLQGNHPLPVQTAPPAATAATEEAQRVARLEAAYQEAIGKKDWEKAAELLNGFDNTDIEKRIKKLNHDQLFYLKLGALRHMTGWSDRVTKPIDAKDAEAGRVAQLFYDYEQAVGKDWGKAAQLLNAFNDDDILSRLKALSPADLQAMKTGALTSMPGWSTRVIKPLYGILFPTDFPFKTSAIQAVWDSSEKSGNPGSANQIAALHLLDTSRSGPWSALSWTSVSSGAAARVYHPEQINQQTLGVCGSAASLNAQAAIAAVDYANDVIGVFTKGEAAGHKVNDDLLAKSPLSTMDQSDWMMLTAMQDVSNTFLDYHGEEGDTWRAGLTDSQIKWSIEHFSGVVKSTKYSCAWWGELDATKTVNGLMSANGDKVVVIMIVSADVLQLALGMGGKSSGSADHAIRLLAPVTLTGTTATINVFTWGSNYTATIPVATYEKLVFAFIVGAKDKSIAFP